MFSAAYPSMASDLLTKWANFLHIIKLNIRTRKSNQVNGSLDYIIKNVRKDQTIVCIGMYTSRELVLLKRAIGSSGKLVVFVPNIDTKNQLSKVAQLFGWLNVTIALIQHSDITREFIVEEKTSGKGVTKEAVVVDIKDVSFRKAQEGTSQASIEGFCRVKDLFIDVVHLKIEVNNLELLQSTEGIIKRFKPTVIVEYEVSKTDRNFFYKAIGFLIGLRYKGFFVLDTLNIPLANFDFDIYQNPRSNFYCNTFVFTSC